MPQYSKRLVAIHWLTLFLFIAAFYLGHELDEAHDAAAKMALYPFHFVIGDLLLIVTLLRTYFIRKDGKPAPLAGGNPLGNKIAIGVHHLLYALLIALPVSGIALITTSGLLEAVQARDLVNLPEMGKFALHEVHEVIAKLLLLTIVIHVLAALHHQFILKDNILRRIIFKRFPD